MVLLAGVLHHGVLGPGSLLLWRRMASVVLVDGGSKRGRRRPPPKAWGWRLLAGGVQDRQRALPVAGRGPLRVCCITSPAGTGRAWSVRA